MKKNQLFSKALNRLKNLPKIAKVDVWAMCYERIKGDDLYKAIPDAKITDLYTGEVWKTDERGYTYFKTYPGKKLTLMMEKEGYGTVQSPTVIVPLKGLTGQFNEIAFQTPSTMLYNLLLNSMGKPKEGCSHVVSTIQRAGFNMHTDRGMPGAKVFLYNENGDRADSDLYLGQVFNTYTDWLSPFISLWSKNAGMKRISNKFKEATTSRDGAAVFLNVPNGKYILEAEKEGVEFTKAYFEVLDNSPTFINVAPPHSPHVIDPESKKKKRQRYNPKY